MARMVVMGQEYYDTDSNLNSRIIARKELAGGAVVIIENLLDANGVVCGYDVAICRNNKLPHSEDWGKCAWSWITKKTAEKQFAGINKI